MLYARASRLVEELRIAHGDGSFTRRLGQLARIDLLPIDDFGKPHSRPAIAPIYLNSSMIASISAPPSSPVSYRLNTGTNI